MNDEKEHRLSGDLTRGERLQIMLTPEELALVDDWRFKKRMPSRAAAVRELLKRGLAAEGFDVAAQGQRSQDFGINRANAQNSAQPAPTSNSDGKGNQPAG